MATCWMTNLPVRTAYLIDEENKCCNDFIPITCTYEEALKLEKNTFRQVNSEEWCNARRNGLTASRFPNIIKRKKHVTEKSVKSIMTPLKIH